MYQRRDRIRHKILTVTIATLLVENCCRRLTCESYSRDILLFSEAITLQSRYKHGGTEQPQGQAGGRGARPVHDAARGCPCQGSFALELWKEFCVYRTQKCLPLNIWLSTPGTCVTRHLYLVLRFPVLSWVNLQLWLYILHCFMMWFTGQQYLIIIILILWIILWINDLYSDWP